MPIYEFYCSACNTLLSFFSTRVDTQSSPACPRCEHPDLSRRPSSFATLKHQGEGEEDDPFSSMDESELERLMGSMMNDMEGLDEDSDPRQLAGAFRRFGEAAGMEPGPRLEEMLSRLEAGEDPDALEAEFDQGEDQPLDDFFRLKRRLAEAARSRPRVDETLYFL